MNGAQAEKILDEINREHKLTLSLYADVLDPSNITEEELRAMALQAGGIEEEAPEQEEPEEESLAGTITRPEQYAELFQRGMAALKRKSETEKEARRATSQTWLK